jgi:RNA polymerase sigma factor (TIGR02999 family)
VLIDHARARNRKKRGSGQDAEPLDPDLLLTDEMAEELILLDAALQRLAQANERAARVVEQRFFAGLTLEETAHALGVSLKTVQRDWILARAWLRKEIGADLPEGGGPPS